MIDSVLHCFIDPRVRKIIRNAGKVCSCFRIYCRTLCFYPCVCRYLFFNSTQKALCVERTSCKRSGVQARQIRFK